MTVMMTTTVIMMMMMMITRTITMVTAKTREVAGV
jgi:hypothetical protein